MLLLLAFWSLSETLLKQSVFYGTIFLITGWLLYLVSSWRTLLISLLLLLSLGIAIQTRPVQTWLVARVTANLSRSLHTEISIDRVDFSLFNKMLLRQTLVMDQHKDTLLYAGTVNLRITDWFFVKDKIELEYIALNDANIKLQRSDSVWNYQFLINYFSSPKHSSDSSTISLGIQKVFLGNIHLLKRDGWRGEDMELYLKSLALDVQSISFPAKKARIDNLSIVEPIFSIHGYPGNRPPLAKSGNSHKLKNDPANLRWNPAGWDVELANVQIENGSFRDDNRERPAYTHFDGAHIYFSSVNWNLKQLRLNKDTLSAQINLATKERSGFEVKKLVANLKFYPEAMEFSKMDIETGRSHLRNYFSMHYNSFDDMSDFIERVTMDGNFTDADIDSDDIAYFAPELLTWKKSIKITGRIHGTVSDLQGRNVQINAGRNTSLNGDIRLRGLPDIDQTEIEFKSNDFRTTYKDVITFIPSLEKITQPRIDRIETLRFQGTFKGLIRDFQTSGTIETNLGNVISDLNMQLPENGPAVYSGTVTTDNLDLGKLLDKENMGKISFQGKINGKGLVSKNLNASLDGEVKQFTFNNYTYQNILVNGAIAKRKFNGRLVSADSSLVATLNGLIDFSQSQPRFDFNADISKSNLKNLHFTADSIDFNGKLRFNFTGDNIDNFLGIARIYDASIYRNGNRLSFDSLSIESSLIENNKTITVVSNEFDGAIVGEFKIRELPNAFQVFLNRYYPSFVTPGRKDLAEQNFSFVITTKNITDYLDFFDKKLKGFNHTSITGRIDTRGNLLDLNADIPQFSYKNISFYNVNLKGRGSFDSLSMESNMGEVYVTDSLHFPATHIALKSFNDLSDIQIVTSANQTLNAANLSARVQTLPNGVRIRFNPSNFDINGKTWTIDKNGELSLSKDVVSAQAFKIYSGVQEISIGTKPSAEGSWNDIYVDLKKINIGDFAPFVVKDDRLEGVLNGSLTVTDPFNKPFAQFKGEAEQFRLDDDSIGKISLGANYSRASGKVNATVSSDNKDYHFDLQGIFNTADSATQPININIPNITDTKVNLLEKYLSGVFTNVGGYASGSLNISGTGHSLNYVGDLKLRDGSLKIAYTQCTYKIPSAIVHMRADYIDFGSFEIKDTLGNTATVTRGKLSHHSFRDLRYDFALNTNHLLMLNTRFTDNNQFYGTLIGKANITLTGPNDDIQMYVRGEPTDSSNIYLPTTTSRESADADFIVWKKYGKEMKPQNSYGGNNFTVTLDITANNYANCYVIIDPLTKDIIKANGHGNLRIKVGTNESMDIRGRYEIDRGNYNFTFQSFIKKPFLFKEGASNYIQWTGNPYDADVSIQAIYQADNVQFNDLGSMFLLSSPSARNYHGTVWVVATLNNKLMKPDISFDIEWPPNSELKNNPQVELFFNSIIFENPNELNKQVAYLLVFNSFGPVTNSVEAFSANEAVGGIFVNSISGAISSALSHQFSNVFQKVFNDKSIRVNFNTGFYNGGIDPTTANAASTSGTYDRTNLNLSVIKSFLNERLTFTVGSALDFGLTPTQQLQTAAVQFLPDITAEWKVTPNGRVVLTFFYRDSYNYLSVANHTQNSSGTSISYRRDFDRIDELFKSKKKDKKEKKKEPDTPKETSGAKKTEDTVSQP